MELNQDIYNYCIDHDIPIEKLHLILNEPKVVPMIRGIGFEYVLQARIEDNFKKSKNFKVLKPSINAQLNIADKDLEIHNISSGKKYILECKLSQNNSFKFKGRFSKSEYCQIKVMRSRTLGDNAIKLVQKHLKVSKKDLNEHRDSYHFSHFDYVITNLRNAFYRTIDGQFRFSPTEQEIEFLKSFFKVSSFEEIDEALKTNNYFAESKLLTPKFSGLDCRKKICSKNKECEFIPNYPIFQFQNENIWKNLELLESDLT